MAQNHSRMPLNYIPCTQHERSLAIQTRSNRDGITKGALLSRDPSLAPDGFRPLLGDEPGLLFGVSVLRLSPPASPQRPVRRLGGVVRLREPAPSFFDDILIVFAGVMTYV